MLKKTLIIGLALTFSLGILGISIYRLSVKSAVIGQETERSDQESQVETQQGEEATQSSQPVDYALTWPGILPDHFLYPMKMIRDRIWLFLTTDSLRKTELLLKMADKRVWSASMLADKQKYDLATSTALKAEGYLKQSVEQEAIARGEGKDTGALLKNLVKAGMKHEEILRQIKEQVPDSNKASIDNAINDNLKINQGLMVD